MPATDAMSAPPAGRSRKTPVEDEQTNAETEAKRRKVRKGTHSCWECKQRKMKCIFGSPTDVTCIRCQRRGTKCVSQEYPEEVSAPLDRGHHMGDRVVRVETLVEQLIKKVGNDGTAAGGENGSNLEPEIPIPAPINLAYLPPLASYGPHEDAGDPDVNQTNYGINAPAGPGPYEALSRALHEALPSREDTEMICKGRGHISTFFHEMMTMPYTALDQNGLISAETLLEIPGPDIHPVLVARHMLQLVIFLQYLHPNFLEENKGLSEPPRAMLKRLADTAISLVTMKDELLGSVEGLECVMLESLYQANGGNLRRSWIAIRRAMVIAQLMGFHRSCHREQYKVLDPKRTKAHPQFMWFQIVFYDRHLCLMLGLPQGSLDHSMASDTMLANDTPLGRLERMHCVLASRILERNESETYYDFSLTEDLDKELQRAARILPSKWWLTPNLVSVINDPQALFWEIRRLVNQLFHYDLLNQLHLPYMLRSSGEHKYDYSKMTCVNASREVLSRFIAFRSFNQIAFCCRAVDFFALMAAMTLLLAHLDSHRSSQTDNLLAHQSLSDRAMIEQVQENMEDVSRLNGDTLSTQSADSLRRLLSIEAEAADGHTHSAESVSVQAVGTETAAQPDQGSSVVRMYIPYFGVIKIAREGIISKEMPNRQHLVASNSQDQPLVGGHSATSSSENRHPDTAMHAPGFTGPCRYHKAGVVAPVETRFEENPHMLQPAPETYTETQAQPEGLFDPFTGDKSVATPFAQPFPSTTMSDSFPQQYEYPGLTAGVDDWAFQGVDLAFFDSLIRGAGDEGSSGTEWAI